MKTNHLLALFLFLVMTIGISCSHVAPQPPKMKSGPATSLRRNAIAVAR